MDRPWIPMPVEGWEEIAEVLAAASTPWPMAAAIVDLRWHADQVRVGRKKSMPGVPFFSQRWQWSARQTRKLLKTDTHKWADSYRAATGQRPISQRTVAAKANAQNKAKADSDRSATDQRPDSQRSQAVPFIRARDTITPEHTAHTADLKSKSNPISSPVERENQQVRGSAPPRTRMNKISLSTAGKNFSEHYPYQREELTEALGRACSAITGRRWCPDGHDPTGNGHTPASLRSSGGEGWPLYRLLRQRGWPPLALWLEQVKLVSRAARECPDPLFANNIRGDDWPSKSDSSRSIREIAKLGKWLEWLDAAQRWADGPQPNAGPAAPASATAAELVQGADYRDLMGLLTLKALEVCENPLGLLEHRRQLTPDLAYSLEQIAQLQKER